MNNFFYNIFQNPSQFVNNINKTHPDILKQAQQMINGKSQDEIKEIVRNLCNEKHINFDEIEKMVNNRK